MEWSLFISIGIVFAAKTGVLLHPMSVDCLVFLKLCLFTTVVLLTLQHINHNFWLLANLHQNMLAKKYCSAVVKTNNFVSNNLIYNFLSVCYDTTF